MYDITFLSIFLFGLIILLYLSFNRKGTPHEEELEEFIKTKYSTSGLSKELSEEYKIKLLELLLDNKIYLDESLNLDRLSKLLGLSRHHTSQVINEHFDLSFYGLLNFYRIQDAKNILSNKAVDDIKIIDLVYKLGFNNKVSFYKAFKKFTNTTPTKYRESFYT